MDKKDSALLKAISCVGSAVLLAVLGATTMIALVRAYQPSRGYVYFGFFLIIVLCFALSTALLLGIRFAVEYIDRTVNPGKYEPEPDEELEEATVAMTEAGLITTDDDFVVRWKEDDQLYLCLANAYISGLDLLLRKVDDQWQLFHPDGAPISIDQAKRWKVRLNETERDLRAELEPSES